MYDNLYDIKLSRDKSSDIENFKGIIAKSNYDATCKDINPSFNFNRFEKLLNDYEPVR